MARAHSKRAAEKLNGGSGRKIPVSLEKCPTGIEGFDDLTEGGLPRGRPTLICGGPGCGKTIFSLEFLVRGAMEHGEPGVFISFEESVEDLRKNVTSMGFDLAKLAKQKLLIFDHVRVERSQIEETGEYDLEGLFIRLGHAIDTIGARRVVLDTIEALFSGLSNLAILRAELRRLFAWLRDKGVTAIVTGERGDGSLTRQGLEEYVSDCVILLDHRVNDDRTTRRLRVVKYRGSTHGTNEYPFLIDREGVSVLPITTQRLAGPVSIERVSTGIARLDTMLGGRGYYRGTNVLVTGTAGSGKTSIAAHFARSSCARGERCVYFAFEESEAQIIRNMRSIGVDLAQPIKDGLLTIQVSRPGLYGLEMHLAVMHRAVEQLRPSALIIDPVTNLLHAGSGDEVNGLLVRLLDLLKFRGITTLLTSLTGPSGPLEMTDVGISSLMDTWLLLRNIEVLGERNRGLYVMKSRGMAHSNQIREFLLTDHGIELTDVYAGPDQVLTGSARMIQEAKDAAVAEQRRAEIALRERRFARKKAALQAQIAALQAELEDEAATLTEARDDETLRVEARDRLASSLARTRRADMAAPAPRTKKRNGRNEVRS